MTSRRRRGRTCGRADQPARRQAAEDVLVVEADEEDVVDELAASLAGAGVVLSAFLALSPPVDDVERESVR